MTHIIVKGRVQGVSYRLFVQKNALKLGLKGKVRNLVNGNVEVFVEGDQAAINELAELCKLGPIAARVDSIEMEEFADKTTSFGDFIIERGVY